MPPSMHATALAERERTPEDDVLNGLRAKPKRLPCRLLYDEIGSSLFEQITGVDDYYLTRNELRLLDAHLPEIAAEVGVAARVIEPGSGSGIKTKRLMRALDKPASYIAIDVAVDALAYTTSMLRAEHPELDIQPVVADFTQSFTLPPARRPRWSGPDELRPPGTTGKTLVFFPGSRADIFEPHDTVALLARLLRVAGPNCLLLLGADGTHDRDALLHAYDDLDGVTAEFNKNVLAHLNRSRDATFDPDAFEHRAVWNAKHSRIELQLVSRVEQRVRVGDQTVDFAVHEPLITEHCYKHSLEAMRGILGAAGWSPRQVYTAHEHPMRLWLCEPRGV